MRTAEKNYDFRKKLLQIHKSDIRDTKLSCNDDEFEITDGLRVYIENDADDVILTAARDFCDYMLTSMNVSVLPDKKKPENSESICIRLARDGEDLGCANGYMGYRISAAKDKISIIAYDERGAAQALYYLEDVMTMRKAPFIRYGEISRKAKFSPRMIHSGYGLDWFPNEHLSSIAHAGMDAILLFVKGVNLTTTGFVDINELIYRARRYGIDVYAYSYIKSEKHPDEPDAEEYYNSTYGRLFEKCPLLKGVILVGESCAFPSKDPHTTGTIERLKTYVSEKFHPGWWPCEDYPEFLELLKKVIRKHNSEAEIILWSYNWVNAPEDKRIELIERLPKDVCILATYEMGEFYEKDGITERTADYTLSRVGPAPRFIAEAKAAKRRGLKLYAMANTGGLTWDFGMIPYEPFPHQWQKRIDGLLKAKEEYGLSGIMESHHYGFYPSFISELVKWNYTEGDGKPNDILRQILASHYGEENADKLNAALKLWSSAIDCYIAVNSDQYGPFRIGPAYPLCFTQRVVPPSSPYAHFGTGILDPEYSLFTNNVPKRVSIPQLAIRHELESLYRMEKLMLEGIEILESIENTNDELLELLELGKYILCCVRTAINVKRFCIARLEMNSSLSAEKVEEKLDEMESIAREEIENARSAIPYVRHNSRLGWEPSMEYLGDEEHINWKISQVEDMIKLEIGGWRQGLSLNLKK